jgi:hypothetical protein
MPVQSSRLNPEIQQFFESEKQKYKKRVAHKAAMELPEDVEWFDEDEEGPEADSPNRLGEPLIRPHPEVVQSQRQA